MGLGQSKNPLNWWTEEPKAHPEGWDYVRIALGWIMCLTVCGTGGYVGYRTRH